MLRQIIRWFLTNSRVSILQIIPLIDLDAFKVGRYLFAENSKHKIAREFLKIIGTSEIAPGSFVNPKYAHKSRDNKFLKIFYGHKLYNHVNPQYGDYIFNVVGNRLLKTKFTRENFDQKISIVIPTYGAYEDVQVCIQSLKSAKTQVNWHLIVIDDASPNLDERNKIKNLCIDSGGTFIQNEKNLGFVATINKAISESKNDLIVLNSDTEVYDNWLEGFVTVLDDKTATITALSNNASIFSFGVSKNWNDEIIRKFSKSMNSTLQEMWPDPIEIPTSHGFCMYITRSALNAIGEFDAETFGLGYGEEIDFSLRASQFGFKNILTPRTFVYHRGSASFGASNFERKEDAEKLLLAKWPNYLKKVNMFLDTQPIAKLELQARRYRALNPEGKVTLQFSHGLGGGTDIALRNEVNKNLLPDYVNYWIKPSKYQGCVELHVLDHGGEILLHDAVGYGPDIIASNMKSLEIDSVVIHHEMGYERNFLSDFLNKLNVPFDYRIHDYLTLCPFLHFVTESGEYCGEPDTKGCNSCIKKRQKEFIDIERWREHHAKLLFSARSVSAPNVDVVRRFQRYHPNLKVIERSPESNLSRPGSSDELKKKIVIIGAISTVKGVDNLIEIIQHTSSDYRFFVVGFLGGFKYPERFQNLINQKKLVVLGKYDNDDTALAIINEINPDAFLFPGKIPETYSYTLDLALTFDKPVIACDIGAVANRIPLSKFIKFQTNSTPREISELIEEKFFIAS